jgi:hypothetical protein
MRWVLRDFSRKTHPAIALLARRRFSMTFYNLAQSSRTDIDGICAFPVSVTSSSRQIALMVRGATVGASNDIDHVAKAEHFRLAKRCLIESGSDGQMEAYSPTAAL